jgi:hypothetical protein
MRWAAVVAHSSVFAVALEREVPKEVRRDVTWLSWALRLAADILGWGVRKPVEFVEEGVSYQVWGVRD